MADNMNRTGNPRRMASAAASAAPTRPSAQHPMQPGSGQPQEEKKSKKRTLIIVLICVVAALLVWLLIWLFACNGSSLFDPNARNGQAPYKTQEEMQAELDRVVDEGMFNISIASAIEFADGNASGTAYIENVPGNPYNMQVTITEDSTGDVLYESGVLAPNQYIENITLTKDLDEGVYSATATFSALDQTTYEEVGQAAAKLTLNVLS